MALKYDKVSGTEALENLLREAACSGTKLLQNCGTKVLEHLLREAAWGLRLALVYSGWTEASLRSRCVVAAVAAVKSCCSSCSN